MSMTLKPLSKPEPPRPRHKSQCAFSHETDAWDGRYRSMQRVIDDPYRNFQLIRTVEPKRPQVV